jgi:hypothetical protein
MELSIMKKILSVLFCSVICFQITKGQTTLLQGKPIAEIFTDFHYVLNDSTKLTGFDLNRAFLGYKFLPGGDFSSTIIINVGTPLDLAAGAVPKRYSYFREASITYTKEKLTISFGIASTRIFDFQQRFWGKRYIAAEFQSLYGYGFVADLGVVMDYKFNDIVKVDFTVMNGEGYTNIQVDNSLKTSFGVSITTPNNLYFRLYGDVMKPKELWQATFVTFAGYKNDVISFGAEASYKSHLDLTQGHDVWGVSATTSLFPDKKFEYFVRYDYSASVVVPEEELPWDYRLDGSYLIGGIQRNFSSDVKLALNYRTYLPYASEGQHTHAIYLNALFKFGR